MKVSLNWVKEFTKVDLPIDELVQKIGAQLGAVEEVVNLGERYQGIVIVKVMECKELEGSDHLSLCKVDDGGKVKEVERDENGHVQVVCGAPNVREGMMVAWLPPGATVPASFDGDKFILEAREIRGQKSNGMLASAKELAIGDSHEGLLELEVAVGAEKLKQNASPAGAIHNYREQPSIKPGDDFAEAYKLDDYVIDIENKMFTHRPDCFGMLGIAREIAGITGQQFTSPAVYKVPKTAAGKTSELLEIRNEIPQLVPRFVAQLFHDVAVGPSPVWLQTYLSRVGIRPINNVVDITNYFMVLTGQPLHAYDYDKVKTLSGGDKAVIVVRNPHSGEKLALLNGKDVEPRPEAIVIATDKQAIGLGGVMGGADTEVSSETKNIILECASFDMYSIRRTSMAHGLFTDAVTRFTKGQSPLQNDRVVAWTVDELVCDAAAVPADVIDDNHVEPADLERGNLYPPVTVSTQYINARLGLALSAEEIKTLLENVEFTVEASGDSLKVLAPFWRTDIELREDVVEEVGRLYGYDHLPLELPKRDLTPAHKDALLEGKDRVRDLLSSAGANEVLTYSFVHGNLLEKTGQDKSRAYQLSNALSPDLQYYRLSLMPSLLDKVHPNIKAGYDEFALFEIGKAHGSENGQDEGGLPKEFEFTALVFAAADKLKKQGAPYFEARKYLTQLVDEDALELRPLSGEALAYAVTKPYDEKRSAQVYLKGGEFLGIIGEFKPSVTRNLKLPEYCSGFEVDTTVLQKQLAARPSYAPLFKFPKVMQDITLATDATKTFADVYSFVDKELGANAPNESHILLEPLDIYQNPEQPDRKHFSFRITITAENRTLTDKEVSQVLDEIAAAAQRELGAERL